MNREEMRMYESVVILRLSLGDSEIQQFTDTYTARLEQGGSEIIKVDNWGKRKLAYELKGERKGTYLRELIGIKNEIRNASGTLITC